MRRVYVSALALVLSAAGTASAGPIEWGYLAYIGPGGGEGRLRLGTIAGPGGDQEVAASLRGEDLEAPGFGSQRIRIASLLDMDVTTDGPGPLYPHRDQFTSDLTITDFASGESGQVSIFGTGKYFGDDLLLDRRVMLELLGGDDGRRELTLGGNRYGIAYSVVQGADDRISTLVADVTVTSATPEPGTLALAGVGFAAVLGRRLCRKS
jgi:hypothetical protein